MDQTVVDFFSLSCHNLTTLQLFDVKEIHMDDLRSQYLIDYDVLKWKMDNHYFTNLEWKLCGIVVSFHYFISTLGAGATTLTNEWHFNETTIWHT